MGLRDVFSNAAMDRFRSDTLVPHGGDDDHRDSGNPGLGLLQDKPGIAVWKLVVEEYGRERFAPEELDRVVHSRNVSNTYPRAGQGAPFKFRSRFIVFDNKDRTFGFGDLHDILAGSHGRLTMEMKSPSL